MPTAEHRKEFEAAIWKKDSSWMRELLQRDDAKELLLMKRGESLPIHEACRVKVSKPCLQLILDAAVEHGITKQMLEQHDDGGKTCLHLACFKGLFSDSLRLLLEYLSKFADINKVLEAKDKYGSTCLHLACENNLSSDSFCVLFEYLSKYADIKKVLEEKVGYHKRNCLHVACDSELSTDSLRLLVSFFTSKELFENVLAATDTTDNNKKYVLIKQLIQDPDCWQKCRLWLLQNHEETFLYSLYPNSLDKTCQALLDLKNGLQHSQKQATVLLIALMSSPSKFREAIDKTDSSAPMSSYFDVVKKGDNKSDCEHWRKNIGFFRECYGQWPPSDRQTVTRNVPVGCTCVIQ